MSKILRDFDCPDMNNPKRLNLKDYFELVYLRHKYFRKSVNPSPQRLAEFEEMTCNIADKYYMKNFDVLKTIGMEMDDVRNIGRVHVVSFLSMGGLKENTDLMKKFTERHKKKHGKTSEPSSKDVFKKECYDLARFLKQRFQELVMFSDRKNRNIVGDSNKVGFYIGSPKNDPIDIDLFREPEVYGYKEISKKEYKEMLEQNSPKDKKKFINKNGELVRAVYLRPSYFTNEDIRGSDLDCRRNSFYRSPEENAIIKEHFAEKKKTKTRIKRKNMIL